MKNAIDVFVVWAFCTMLAILIWQSQQPAQPHYIVSGHRPSQTSAYAGNSRFAKDALSAQHLPGENSKGEYGSVTDWLLVFIGGGQIALFYWQLGLIRVSLNDAKKATKAATDSAIAATETGETMKLTAERQLRAYISVEPAGIEPWGALEIVGHIRLRNAGGVPARDVEIATKIEYQEIGEDEEFQGLTVIIVDDDGRESEVGLSGVGSIQPQVSIIHGSEHIRIPQGSGYLFVWGAASYLDGFSTERRITVFCHRYPCELLSYRSPGKPFVDAQYARYHHKGNDST